MSHDAFGGQKRALSWSHRWGACEPHVGAGTQTRVLQKSNKYS